MAADLWVVRFASICTHLPADPSAAPTHHAPPPAHPRSPWRAAHTFAPCPSLTPGADGRRLPVTILFFAIPSPTSPTISLSSSLFFFFLKSTGPKWSNTVSLHAVFRF